MGVVSDPSNAIVKGAKVILTDAVSTSARETVSNSDGYFTFASVPVGKYELNIEAKGFNAYKLTDINLSGGDKRNVDAQLTVGTTSQAVDITASAETLA